MSIKEMIQDHPHVGDDYNSQLGEAVKHAMYGAAIINSCADACLAEDDAKERAECIRRCLDASDACTAFYRMGSRRTGSNEAILKQLLELCAQMCERCAAMCEMHDDAHCQRCAKMCRECADYCRKAAGTITP